MRKHTTRYYLKRIAAAESALRRWESMYRRMKAIADYRYEHGIIDTPEYWEKATAIWNKCQDELYRAKEHLHDCRRDYDQRDWNVHDYYIASLIADNID